MRARSLPPPAAVPVAPRLFRYRSSEPRRGGRRRNRARGPTGVELRSTAYRKSHPHMAPQRLRPPLGGLAVLALDAGAGHADGLSTEGPDQLTRDGGGAPPDGAGAGRAPRQPSDPGTGMLRCLLFARIHGFALNHAAAFEAGGVVCFRADDKRAGGCLPAFHGPARRRVRAQRRSRPLPRGRAPPNPGSAGADRHQRQRCRAP